MHRQRRAARVLAAASGTLAALYIYDTHRQSRAIQRNLRALTTAALIVADYKLRFNEHQPQEVLDAIHARTAERILDVCRRNGGLYVKMGQGLALQSAILPVQFSRVLRVLFDDAPGIGLGEVRRLIREDMGAEVEELFREFDEAPVASASIAQVHRAVLHDGSVVAVKVQKPEIRDQIKWDLWMYRWLMRGVEWSFDLPVLWTVDYTSEHLCQEVDFVNEATNAQRAWMFIQREPELRGRVYVPRIHWDLTTSRVMTAEWVDGVRATDRDALRELGLAEVEVARAVVDLFSHQIFNTGFLHCDPHPGNILVRRDPRHGTPGNGYRRGWRQYFLGQTTVPAQIVLLDHGLYITESDVFRRQYAQFWQAMFLRDHDALKRIAAEWGIHDVDIFASATLMRPYSSTDPNLAATASSEQMASVFPGHRVSAKTRTKEEKAARYALQLKAKERAKQFFRDTKLIPQELILVGRNMNIVRSINKELGSPVNRIRIMAEWAAASISWSQADIFRELTPSTASASSSILVRWKRAIQSRWNRWRFRIALWILEAGFQSVRTWQILGGWLQGRRGGALPNAGFEDRLDRQMIGAVEKEFGIKVDADAFAG